MTTFSESDIREAFQTFDRDGNGFIGASDLHNTYLAINENLTDDEVDELIRLVDHDGDGQVSYEEFRKMVEFTWPAHTQMAQTANAPQGKSFVEITQVNPLSGAGIQQESRRSLAHVHRTFCSLPV
mmetsp:Transcript_12381/g.19522  ORF Transcript_12381/g.19522 Transcript_12381/m.19522 type:complete len:126 (-) Transcript_12381:955-1332(-)